MASPTDVKLRIIAENLARAALQEAKKDVQGVGQAAGTSAAPFANLVRYFDQGNRTGQLFRNALQQLSFQASNIPGPVGKAGSAILGLGISGGPILIATAALGAFALAWKKAEEAGERAAKNAESAGERLRRVFASTLQGGNTEEFGERLDLFRQRLAEARKEQQDLAAAPLAEQRFRQEVTPQGLTVSVPLNNPQQERAEQLAAVATKVNQAQALVAQAEEKAREAADKATASLERQANVLEASIGIRGRAIATGQNESQVLVDIAAATARVQAATMGLDQTRTDALVSANVRLERLRQESQLLSETSALGRQGDALAAVVAIRERAIATGQDEAATLGAIAEATARVTAEALAGDETQTAALVARARRLEQLREENRVLEAQRDLLQDLAQIEADVVDFTLPREVTDRLSGATHVIGGEFFQQELAKIKIPTLNDLLGQERIRQADLDVTKLEKRGSEAAFTLFDSPDFQASLRELGAEIDKVTERFDDAGQKLPRQARVAAESLQFLSLIKQGGAGNIIGGAGGVLQSLGALKGLGQLTPVGIGLTALGGLTSLFGNSNREAERRHREEMEELRRIRENTTQRDQPANTDVHIYLDGEDVTDRVMYNIARAARTRGTPSLPPR